jgi:hypothetical protein
VLVRACVIAALAGCSSTSAPAQRLPIGTACTTSLQCGDPPSFFCDTDHPNGYCKRDCKSDGDCPPEAICAFDGAVGECHKKCDTVADCRQAEGYICKPASTNPVSLASHSYCDAPEPPPPDGGANG